MNEHILNYVKARFFQILERRYTNQSRSLGITGLCSWTRMQREGAFCNVFCRSTRERSFCGHLDCGPRSHLRWPFSTALSFSVQNWTDRPYGPRRKPARSDCP